MSAYRSDSRDKCPHCLTVVRFEDRSQFQPGAKTDQENLNLTVVSCPQCRRLILTIEVYESHTLKQEFTGWPLGSARPVPDEVPPHIVTDYTEAALVLNLAPKASAALSRRCLQAVLNEAGGTKQRDLSKQINEVMPKLPTYIAENLDAVRHIGNFAAHPTKDQVTGQIVDVEPGEAEWNLDVLDQLFDFYYVQPALAKQKRDALNTKLQAAGKQPMKSAN